MALNKYMHPRNIYKQRKPDYKVLAIKYPEFRKHVYQDLAGNIFLDYKYPPSLRQLTVTLLKEDFGLDIELPLDRLIPTIPLRLNYILWIEDILGKKGDNPIKGIDIGTGASCIYPILGCHGNKWSFLATEVDDMNFTYAEKNVASNKMNEHIKVLKVSSDCILYDALKDKEDQSFDFCMCNPPFFSDHLEAQAVSTSRSADRPDPRSVNTASATESIVRGGEVVFIKRLITDSLKLKSKVRVYTTMVGKKTSLPEIKEELRKQQIPKYSTTEFCQGKTMRWGVAWTFDKTVNFPKSLFQQSKKEKPPLLYVIPEDITEVKYDLVCILQRLKELLGELKISFKDHSNTETLKTLDISAKENTWSHQRRKRREQLRQADSKPTEKKATGETTSNIETGEVAVVKGELTSTVVTGPLQSTSTIKTGEVTSTVLTGEITSTKETGEKSFNKTTVEATSMVTGEVTPDIPTCTSNSPSLQQIKATLSVCESFNEKSSDNSESTCICDSSTTEDMHVCESSSKVDSQMPPESQLADSMVSQKGDKNVDLNKIVSGTKSKKRKRSINNKTCVDQNHHNKHARIDSVDRKEDDHGLNQKHEDHVVSDIVSKTCNSENLVLPVKSCDSEETSLNTVYENQSKEEPCLLHCYLSIKVVSRKINLEMEWIDGEKKDSMQQVMQFFKNKFRSPKMDNNNSKPNKPLF